MNIVDRRKRNLLNKVLRVRRHLLSMQSMLWFATCLPGIAIANDSLTIAVASNFTTTAAEIAAKFTEATDISVIIVAGSTGKLYAQIVNGAPFDIYLAADAHRPELLERSGHAVTGTRITYAIGALVLWSQDATLKGRDCREALQAGAYGHIALANPQTAPYGLAARDVLVAAGLWEQVSERAVFGENIIQTFQFVATGNATLGFVARSQVIGGRFAEPSCAWPVPSSLHAELRQQAVVLSASQEQNTAEQFLQYLQSATATEILLRHGYTLSR